MDSGLRRNGQIVWVVKAPTLVPIDQRVIGSVAALAELESLFTGAKTEQRDSDRSRMATTEGRGAKHKGAGRRHCP